MAIISVTKKFTKLAIIAFLFLPVVAIYSLGKNVSQGRNFFKKLTYFTGAVVGSQKISADVPNDWTSNSCDGCSSSDCCGTGDGGGCGVGT
jgi:hypothetical protein